MKKTTLFEETSYWCSINMAEGLVKQRFEKTEGKSRKSLSFSLLEKIKKPKSPILTSKEVKENSFANKLTSWAQRDARSGKHQIHGLEENRLVIQILRQR